LKRREAATQPIWVDTPKADEWGDSSASDEAWESAPAPSQAPQ
jgi:hypothetical protein